MKSFFRWQSFLFGAMLLLVFLTVSVEAQNAAFTYQGRLTDNAPQGGTYLLKFELFDASIDGALIDTLTDVPATVANNVFTVELNFAAANAFDGGERFLQISVRRSASESYVTLAPRQKINAAPYAVRALTAANALQLDGTPASQIIREGDTRLTDSRQPLAGSGDYIQNQNVTPQASTNFNISGTGTANIFNAATQFNIGGNRVLFTTPFAGKTFVGINAGRDNINGAYISFFGEAAGRNNTNGTHNAFFGSYSGSQNTTGSFNSFLGADAGFLNVTGEANTFVGFRSGWSSAGSENTFVGSDAGWQTTTGIKNVFVGRTAGVVNKTGSNNTFIGYSAEPTIDNLNFATAIGANAIVSTSNTIVLGRSAGQDTVQVPGTLNAARLNAQTQFNLNNFRILAAGSENTFLGFNNGLNNTTGWGNSFFGFSAGNENTIGTQNSFFGFRSGIINTSGGDNSFFGKDSGSNNTTGSRNTFVGTSAGFSNAVGSDNTALGFNANVANNLTFATAIGANASVSTSNTIVLGRNGGQDTVQVPGKMTVGGGDVYVDNPGAGVIMRAPNGNCFRLTIANNGALATAGVACPQ